MDCVFCKIAAHQLPAEILYETENVVAILDINPIHYGHALVIPKTHCTDFLHVRERDLHDVLHVTQIVARAMVQSLELEGFNIFSNNGKAAGQSVFHFHMHVTPRYPDDDIKFVLTLKTYDGNAMATYAEKIRRLITN
ncbi:MAG: HIT domain-containing protein [Bacteroidetes bacterium]|nr:HIT domain-containing protein [Bacteroidota bacterium]MCW5897176.1 HIT domain-containing protein [Bacteroidota bacterium]